MSENFRACPDSGQFHKQLECERWTAENQYFSHQNRLFAMETSDRSPTEKSLSGLPELVLKVLYHLQFQCPI
jgi:hypothetical protein